MALKFLNKKGWHTGSLRNIENVWKAEQKRDAEEKKLEELRKQIHEERGRAEFRQLQIDSGLIPKQERLEFLYDSGLAVGKGSSNFKALESAPKTEPDPTASASTSAKQQSAAPGALFEEKEKPQTANDAWRKLHSDPLLLIRQREQESLARVKNNPVQMAMIRKSVEAKKSKDKDENKHGKKHHRKKSKHRKHSSSENDSDSDDAAPTVEKGKRESRHKDSRTDKPSSKTAYTSDEEPSSEEDTRRKEHYDKEYKEKSKDQQRSNKSYHNSRRGEYSSELPIESRHDNKRSHFNYSDKEYTDKSEDQQRSKKSYQNSRREEYSSERQIESRHDKRSHLSSSDKEYKDKSEDQQRSNKSYHNSRREEYSSERPTESRHNNKQSHFSSSDKPPRDESSKNRHRNPVKLSEEERAARLREMEMDAEKHEQQRWKRIKKAADSDAQEANRDHASLGRNFIDAAQKSIYGAEKGGSSTIEESVRRRAHYLQRREPTDSNAFRRS